VLVWPGNFSERQRNVLPDLPTHCHSDNITP
jgi:hypothetical protein